MIKISKQLANETKELLNEIIGKILISYIAEPFIFSNQVFSQVELNAGGSKYFINCELSVIDYFGAPEDISFLDVSLQPSQWDAHLKKQETRIERTITSVWLVQETQEMYESGVKTYELSHTAGIIFVLDDDIELSFERSCQFDESIAISRGHNLMDGYVSPESLLESDDPDISFNVIRHMEKI